MEIVHFGNNNMNLIETVKGLLSQDLAIKTYECIANNDKALLYQMGLDDEAIACLNNNGETNMKLAVLAFEKAISVQTYVDPEIIRKAMVNNSKHFKEETLINNLVTSGAGYEMIRHFIKVYTNRKHTRLRQVFSVNDSDINKDKNSITEEVADNLFASFEKENRAINIQDILNFSNEKNYSMSSIWRELKIFINNNDTK